MTEKKFKYSEIFGNTIQGEGKYTGVPTVWFRSFFCNLSCDGFGQKDPTNPNTWELPYQELDVEKYKDVNELPVFEYGCDSSYSWSRKFGCLTKSKTSSEIVDEIESLLPGGTFKHPKSGQYTHMAFTGGEPMLTQPAIVAIMDEFRKRKNTPKNVTIETNGTLKIKDPFREMVFKDFTWNEKSEPKPELFWSVSPKLYLSGEDWKNTIKPEVVGEYNQLSPHGQLKYVCDGSERAWDEVEEATRLYRVQGVNWPVWIMPVGATKEEQEELQANVAEQAIERGYNVAARVHCFLFGNKVGK